MTIIFYYSTRILIVGALATRAKLPGLVRGAVVVQDPDLPSLLGPLNTRCRSILRTQKGTVVQ